MKSNFRKKRKAAKISKITIAFLIAFMIVLIPTAKLLNYNIVLSKDSLTKEEKKSAFCIFPLWIYREAPKEKIKEKLFPIIHKNIQESKVEEPKIKEMKTELPIDKPIVAEPLLDQPIPEKPIVDQPAVDQPAVDQPAVDQPEVNQAAVDQPEVDQPAVDQLAVDQPEVDKPEVDQPVAEEPILENQKIVETNAGDEYFNDAIFIGNSLTEGLKIYSRIPTLKVYASKGIMANTIFTSKVIGNDKNKITIIDAIKENPNFNKVYINLGINELGWPNIDAFTKKYAEIIDVIIEINSNAIIYVQSIVPVTEKISAHDKIYNNENIQKFNEKIKEMAAGKNVVYIDIYKEMITSDGFLPEELASDGIHLNAVGYNIWLDVLEYYAV